MSQFTRASKSRNRVLVTPTISSPTFSSLKKKNPAPTNKCSQGKKATPVTKSDDTGVRWVQCDSCNKWEIQENADFDDSRTSLKDLHFSCHFCVLTTRLESVEARLSLAENSLISYKDQISSLQFSLDSLDAKYNLNDNVHFQNVRDTVNQLTSGQASFAGKMKALEEQLSGPPDFSSIRKEFSDEIAKKSDCLSSEQIRIASTEMEEISKRKLNLIISGLPELNGDDLSNLLSFVNDFHHLPRRIVKADIVASERLGKSPNPNFPRLLRVSLGSQTVRRQILTMHRTRIEGACPAVFVRPDLSRMQEAADKILRDRLMTVGKDKFRIAKGKIIPREPTEMVCGPTVAPEMPQASGSSYLGSMQAGSDSARSISNSGLLAAPTKTRAPFVSNTAKSIPGPTSNSATGRLGAAPNPELRQKCSPFGAEADAFANLLNKPPTIRTKATTSSSLAKRVPAVASPSNQITMEASKKEVVVSNRLSIDSEHGQHRFSYSAVVHSPNTLQAPANQALCLNRTAEGGRRERIFVNSQLLQPSSKNVNFGVQSLSEVQSVEASSKRLPPLDGDHGCVDHLPKIHLPAPVDRVVQDVNTLPMVATNSSCPTSSLDNSRQENSQGTTLAPCIRSPPLASRNGAKSPSL